MTKLDSIPTSVKKLEKQYKWIEASKQYTNEINIQPNPEITEKKGYALYRAAYQSQTKNEFKKRIKKAVEFYAKASKLYEKTSNVKMNKCKSFSLFTSSLLEDEPEKKKAILDRCLRINLTTLEECRRTKDLKCYVETCSDYLLQLLYRSEYNRNHIEVRSHIEIAYESAAYIFDINEKSLDLTSIRHYLSAIILDKPMEVFDSLEIQQELMKITNENAQKAYEEAKKKQDHYLIGKSAVTLGYITFEVNGDLEASLDLATLALDSAQKTRDIWIKAQANELLGYLTAWHVNYIIDDPQTQMETNLKALKHTVDAINCYRRISKPISLAYINHIGTHYHLARNEQTLEKKIEITRKGIRIGRKDLEETKKTGSELGGLFVLNELIHLMFGLIKFIKEDKEKLNIINETESLIDEIIKVSSRIQPFRIWNISVFKFQAARLKIARSRLVQDQETEISLLLEALEVLEECVRLSKLHLEANPSRALYLDYADGIRQIGELLDYLFAATKDLQYLELAIEIYIEMLEIYEKNELYCRVAENHWKIATIYDNLGNYIKSAEYFDKASTNYKKSSKKMPHLEEYYADYSKYMEAWGEIEQAKLNNFEERYEKVKEHYSNAAKLHASTSRWSYLSNNYMAWAQLAEAELISQKGKSLEAKGIFNQVVDTFRESREKILDVISTIDIHEEQDMAQNLIDASERRYNYCLGRVALEEARDLSRLEEHSASARKYRESVSLFQKVVENNPSLSERNEIIPIMTLCNAWEMMELAEAESSSERYQTAARLFMDAKDLCYTNRTRLLSLGHSNFCSALYEYTKFETSRSMTNLVNANKYLTNATNFYLRAGYDVAKDYSVATQRLYEAYVHMDNASAETEPKEKAKYYILSERLLEESAKSYQRANHPAKYKEVSRLLENVRQERKLALSLLQVLDAPNISSSTMSFTPPSPSREYPAGLESFEHGNIHATMQVKDTDLRSGEKLRIMLELTNTGMSLATLINIYDLPDEDFVPSDVSGVYTYSEGKVDLRSKRLVPLSSEVVTIVMDPKNKGEYTIKPCIEYQDEEGGSRICETEPVQVSVGEMGLRGWLTGPRRRRSR